MQHFVKYFKYLIKHKWFVFLGGLKTKASLWRLIKHDWSKFLPCECVAYANYFSINWPGGICPAGIEAAFGAAWLHHQNFNDHHWQYWILMDDKPGDGRFALQAVTDLSDVTLVDFLTGEDGSRGTYIPDTCIANAENERRYALVSRCVRAANRYRALPMPEACIREMVADWMGAGRAVTGAWCVWKWYDENKHNIVLHPETRVRVEQILDLVI